MKSQIVTAEQAIGLSHAGDTLVCSGFGVVIGQVTRDSTSAFLRDKRGRVIRERGLVPPIYETRAEAEAAL